MAKYKGIEFAKGYNKPFADFKKEFGSTHVFKGIPEENRENELEKAYKIAQDGNVSKSSKQRKKAKSAELDGGDIQRYQKSGGEDITEE